MYVVSFVDPFVTADGPAEHGEYVEHGEEP